MVGLPGGKDGPLFKAFARANKDNMRLVASSGGGYEGGRPLEDDAVNTVYIVDTQSLPFHRAEAYHQYHVRRAAAAVALQPRVCHRIVRHNPSFCPACAP